jgi:F0F1-type ATP synthase membrane subunit b/b'
MDDREVRIGELLLRARDQEAEAAGLKAHAGRLIREAARRAAGGIV